jgi:hypothetical protein
MTRKLTYAVLTLGLLAAACSSDERLVQPNATAVASGSANLAQDPVVYAEIVALIGGEATTPATYTGLKGLFDTYPSCTGNCNAVMGRFLHIDDEFQSATGNPVGQTYGVIDYVLAKWHDGTLQLPDGYLSTGTAVTRLVNLLFSYAGLSSRVCDLSLPDCDAVYYDPNSPATTLTSPNGFAQLDAPAGAGTVTQPTVLSVYRLTNSANLAQYFLVTQLDQYHLQYEFSTSSGETFGNFVTLSLCLADPKYTAGDPKIGRFALAHNVGPTKADPGPLDYRNIQILPKPGFTVGLDCTNADQPIIGSSGGFGLLRDYAMRGFRSLVSAVTPPPLYATAMVAIGGTLSGSSKNLSPFGIVDPEVYITSALTSTDLGAALEGQATSTAPKVKILSPDGTKMFGDSAIFTIKTGTGSLTGNGQTGSSVVVYTDANGEAALDSWTLGSGANSLEVTGAISPCDAPVATDDPATPQIIEGADCGTVVGTVTFTATGVPAITGITSNPSPLPAGIAGVAYPGGSFTATGGDPTNYPFTWSGLSAGLSVNSQGQLSGTPNACLSVPSCTVTLTVSVTDGVSPTVSRSFPITIYPALVLSGPASLPPGIVGVQYPSQAFTASGGDGAYTWSSNPPAGLTFSNSGNPRSLGGTPTATGSFNFGVTVTSGPTPPGASQTKSYTLDINTLATPKFLTEPSGACHTVSPAVVGSGTLLDRPDDPWVTVEVRDSKGNLANGVRVHLEAVLNNGSTVAVTGNDALTGSTGVDGVAVFSSFSISKAGGYQIRASAPWPNAAVTVLSAKFKISPKC